MPETMRRSALEHYPHAVTGIREVRCSAIIQINTAPQDIQQRLKDCAFNSPATVLKAASGEDASLLWSGPDQYLLVSENRPAQKLCDLLDAQLKQTPSTWVDLSQARTVFELSGPNCRDILAKGCPLDVDAMQAGDCAPCLLGHFNILLQCQNQQQFRIFVFRSFGYSCMEWLAHASAEYS